MTEKENGKTDIDLFGGDEQDRLPPGSKGGRPAINREKVKRLINSGKFTTSVIARAVNAHPDSIRRIRRELEEAGELIDPKKNIRSGTTVSEDFDEECILATGMSFKTWTINQRGRSHGMRIFNLCKRVWANVWKKPSLIVAKDRDNPLGDNMAMKYVELISDDPARMRDRKKQIRYIFRFLGRQDVCDKHLRMTVSRDPRAVRTIPEITLPEFPTLIKECVDEITEKDPLYGTIVKTKLVLQARTGTTKKERGFFGIRKIDGDSYIIMSDPDTLQGEIIDKGNAKWPINYTTPQIRAELWPLYEKAQTGENIFPRKLIEPVLDTWKKITFENIGREFRLHDLRKISSTWYFSLNVPLEILAMINVGWRDLNTVKRHYLHLRDILQKTPRRKYAALIPDWFKTGIEEYTDAD